MGRHRASPQCWRFCRKLFGYGTVVPALKVCDARSDVQRPSFKGGHFDCSVVLLRVRWHLAHNLTLRDLEEKEMMAERGLSVDHSTVHRWVVHFSPELLRRFHQRKRAVVG